MIAASESLITADVVIIFFLARRLAWGRVANIIQFREHPVSLMTGVSMSLPSNIGDHKSGTPDQVFFGLPDLYVEKGAHIAHFLPRRAGETDRPGALIQAGLEAGDQCCVLVTEGAVSPTIKDHLGDSWSGSRS